MAENKKAEKSKGGLFAKIFSMAMASMLIPIIIIAGMVSNYVSGKMTTTLDNNLEQLATEKMTELNEMIATQKVLVQTLAKDPYLVEALDIYLHSQFHQLHLGGSGRHHRAGFRVQYRNHGAERRSVYGDILLCE